jgi:hypothetical protein
MTVTNAATGTNICDIAEGICRINTPVAIDGDQEFSFNQYLIVAEKPLLFHTGPHRLFPVIRQAVDQVLPSDRLRYIAFSHVEADECGSLGEWLAVAPDAVPLCSAVAAMTSVGDITDRPAHALRDGETSGSMRRMCRMDGTAASWLNTRPERCFAAICSPSLAREPSRLPIRIFLRQARRSGKPWTIMRMVRTRPPCWSEWQALSPGCWPACMEAPGAAMAGRSFAVWPPPLPHKGAAKNR